MGWNQWGLFRFQNKTGEDNLKLKFPDPAAHWGWPFHDTRNTNTRNQISYDEIERQIIKPQGEFSYGHTGKQNEWAGMDGTVEIYVATAAGGLGEKVCKIYYCCPWSGSTRFDITERSDNFRVDFWGVDYNGSSMGSVAIDIRRI